MSRLGDSFPEEERAAYAEQALAPGHVLRLWCDFTVDAKFKYVVVVAADPEPLGLFINSRIPAFIAKRPALLACQLGLSPSDYPFLQHDSYLDCHTVIDALDEKDILSQLTESPANFVGILTDATKAEVLRVIEAAPTVSDAHRSTIRRALGAAEAPSQPAQSAVGTSGRRTRGAPGEETRAAHPQPHGGRSMADLKIAVMLSSLRMEPMAGFEKIAEMGVTGVHLGVGGGQFHPDNLSKQDRKDLLAHLASLGLEISAVSAWGGGVHLEEDDCTAALADAVKFLELSADLECGIWQGHVGIMPEDVNDPGWANHVRHHEEIAKAGEAIGACLAIETGPEPPYVLKRLIETVGSEAIRLNWDPANLILWPAKYAQDLGEEYDKQKWMDLYQPVEGLKMVGEYVVHVHAKDALVHPDGKRQEVAFGTGWVDWDRFISILHQDYGYDGYFAIEREVGENPAADIQTAVDFLKGFKV